MRKDTILNDSLTQSTPGQPHRPTVWEQAIGEWRALQSNRRHHVAAADWNICAGNEAREIGCEKRDDVGNLLIGAAPAQRHVLFVAFLALRARASIFVTDRPTRRDLIDRNLMRPNLSRQDTEYSIHAALARNVGRL